MLEKGRLHVRAPAKINLALHVTGRRTDGYHDLDSLVVFTELGDELSIEPAASDAFDVKGPFAGLIPDGDRNLVLRARDLFRQRHGRAEPVSIALTKNLPPASGIGGGSSDAAACLVTMAEFYGSDAALSSLGAELGADVPMCLAAEPLIARGIGDDIVLLPSFPSLSMVLVNPGMGVPTPQIFRRLASPDNAPLPNLPGLRDISAWLERCRNDLEIPATGFAPVLPDVLSALDQCGASLARMSGSGATCFGLFQDMAAAALAAEQLRAARPSWFVAATRSYASGEFKKRIDQ